MTPGINTLLLSTGALGSFTCSGMTLPIYMGPTGLRGIRATGDTLSNVESQVFTPYKFGSTAGDRTPDLLTTRPTCYHSATALCKGCEFAPHGCPRQGPKPQLPRTRLSLVSAPSFVLLCHKMWHTGPGIKGDKPIPIGTPTTSTKKSLHV